jgi:hypothetical protein
MTREQNSLFQSEKLELMLDALGRQIEDNVDAIPRDQMLNVPIEDLMEHVMNIMRVEPLTIFEEHMVQENKEIKTEPGDRRRKVVSRKEVGLVPGVRVTVSLPFSGNLKLWELNPNMATSPIPHGIVKKIDDQLVILEMVFEHPMNQPASQLEYQINQNLDLIRKYIAQQGFYINRFNGNLPNILRNLIKARQERLSIQENLVEIIKIPLKHNPSAPSIQSLPIQKRIARPLSMPQSSGSKSEMGIEEKDYEDILSIIRHEGRSFEATPETFAVHGEEDLRNIILSHLNGHYKGDASGETFRRSGKTDIRIEAKDRAAFVAECKVWTGQKTIEESINQLLDYLTWRDCKTAIIIFDKDVAGFTAIRQKTEVALKSHPRINEMLPDGDQGEWRCVFKSKDDDARLLQVHVFLFNLYVASS